MSIKYLIKIITRKNKIDLNSNYSQKNNTCKVKGPVGPLTNVKGQGLQVLKLLKGHLTLVKGFVYIPVEAVASL